MDMFFVVTTVAVAFIAIAFSVVVVYVVRLVRVIEEIAIEAREVARDVHEASERALDDVRSVRDRFAGVFNGISTLFSFASRTASAKTARRTSGKSTKRSASKSTNVTQ
jgi:hypothetical protein